jgi:hypothetical protein
MSEIETASLAESHRLDCDNVRDDGSVTFELVTGIVDEDAPFLPHGHAVRFPVELPGRE